MNAFYRDGLIGQFFEQMTATQAIFFAVGASMLMVSTTLWGFYQVMTLMDNSCRPKGKSARQDWVDKNK